MKCDCGCEFEPIIEYQHRLICGDCTDAVGVPDMMAAGLDKAQADVARGVRNGTVQG